MTTLVTLEGEEDLTDNVLSGVFENIGGHEVFHLSLPTLDGDTDYFPTNLIYIDGKLYESKNNNLRELHGAEIEFHEDETLDGFKFPKFKMPKMKMPKMAKIKMPKINTKGIGKAVSGVSKSISKGVSGISKNWQNVGKGLEKGISSIGKGLSKGINSVGKTIESVAKFQAGNLESIMSSLNSEDKTELEDETEEEDPENSGYEEDISEEMDYSEEDPEIITSDELGLDLLSMIGTTAGGFFGGPAGAAIGGKVAGMATQQQKQAAAKKKASKAQRTAQINKLLNIPARQPAIRKPVKAVIPKPQPVQQTKQIEPIYSNYFPSNTNYPAFPSNPDEQTNIGNQQQTAPTDNKKIIIIGASVGAIIIVGTAIILISKKGKKK